MQYNTRPNFYCVLTKKWLSDIDNNKSFKKISGKFCKCYSEVIKLFDKEEQLYKSVLSKWMNNILIQFYNFQYNI